MVKYQAERAVYRVSLFTGVAKILYLKIRVSLSYSWDRPQPTGEPELDKRKRMDGNLYD